MALLVSPSACCRVHQQRRLMQIQSPFAIISIHGNDNPTAAARALIERSILGFAVYELWGRGVDYTALHEDVRLQTEPLWQQYREPSFRFQFDSFQGGHSSSEQRDIMESFSYMGFEGPIVMNKPDEHFTISEDCDNVKASKPKEVFLGRLIAEGGRKVINKYNLKKRTYISTTSMDAELTLVTANIALAAGGKIAYDPFTGTGSFPLACAHFGASVFGSDLDGRMVRGKKERNVEANFRQYGTTNLYLGGFVADLTNSPLRLHRGRWLDAILCDPPYGVREGLKVLGSEKERLQSEVILANGLPAHLKEGYIPPKRPYSFTRMLDDILHFSASSLVDCGRLCMWMPVAGAPVADDGESSAEAEQTEYAIPQHPSLQVVSVSVQPFNKWSRRLIAYRRVHDSEVDQEDLMAYMLRRKLTLESDQIGHREQANDLNAFRKQYFSGFK